MSRNTNRPASGIHSGTGIFASFIALTLGLGAGCGEPEPLPSAYDDPATVQAIREADGFVDDGVVPLLSGFVHGEPVSYWTLDAGDERSMPIYYLCRPEGDEDCAPIDHPPIVDALPGSPDYSPFGQVHWVDLPEGWSGQLGSLEEIEAEIARLGLEAPRSTSFLRHCAIAAPDVELEVGPDQTLTAETPVYYRGEEVRCFDFSATRANRPVWPDGRLFIRNVYVLQREGEATPLVERMAEVDMNGDGDLKDSNNVFGVGLDDGDYTPLWRMVTVTVPAGLGSIDTYMDEARADYTDSDDMFDTAPDYTITPREGQIIDHELTEELINCPLQSAPGML